jgi:hypothetical protein
MNAVQGTAAYHEGEEPDERYSFVTKPICSLALQSYKSLNNRTVSTCKKVSPTLEDLASII